MLLDGTNHQYSQHLISKYAKSYSYSYNNITYCIMSLSCVTPQHRERGQKSHSLLICICAPVDKIHHSALLCQVGFITIHFSDSKSIWPIRLVVVAGRDPHGTLWSERSHGPAVTSC